MSLNSSQSLTSNAVKGASAYIKHLYLLTDHLANRNYSLHEALSYVLRVILSPFYVNSIIKYTAETSSVFHATAIVGVSSSKLSNVAASFEINDNFPAAIAIQTGSVTKIDTSIEDLENYQHLAIMKPLIQEKKLIVIPEFLDRTPIASVLLIAEKNVPKDNDFDTFLNTVFSLLTLYYTNRAWNSSSERSDKLATDKLIDMVGNGILTERQLVIAQLIKMGRTNATISKNLGYSESTIRQEVMKIFKIYNIHHRSELIKVLSSTPPNL